MLGKIGTLSDSDEKNRYKMGFVIFTLEKTTLSGTSLEVAMCKDLGYR